MTKSLLALLCTSVFLTGCNLDISSEKDTASSNEAVAPIEPEIIPATEIVPATNTLIDLQRFNKLNAEGMVLSAENQIVEFDQQPWSCVADADSDLLWQVPQASGDFAFQHTYYWGDRTINNRYYSAAECGLFNADNEALDCNTDALIARANTLELCGKTDWRLASRAEFNTLLDVKYGNDDNTLAPVNRFYFPYIDANVDEAYWASEYAIYPDGDDNSDIENDWQGENSLVGSAYAVWMENNFADTATPPRSTNEPHFTMLVSGAAIVVDAIDESAGNTVAITEVLNLEMVTTDENLTWKQRFIKRGTQGQALSNQDAESWNCVEDTFYKAESNTAELIATEILWQHIEDTTLTMAYSEIPAYVETINASAICGKTNWRLPTENELTSLLVKYTHTGYDFVDQRAGYVTSILSDTVYGIDFDSSYYWTSSESEYSDDEKQALSFQDAFSASSPEAESRSYRVRLISTARTLAP